MSNDQFILVPEGVAELLHTVTYKDEFWDENSKSVDGNHNVIYVIRCYCKFDGKPIQRNNVRLTTHKRKMTSEYMKVFKTYQREHALLFEKIKKKGTTYPWVETLEYQVSETVWNKLLAEFPNILQEHIDKDKFKWKDVQLIFKKFVPEFNITHYLRYGYVLTPKPKTKIFALRLKSENFSTDPNDHCLLFSDLALLYNDID